MPEYDPIEYPDGDAHDDNRSPRRRRPSRETPEFGVLVTPASHDTLDNLVLYDDARQDILLGLRAIETRDQLEAVWNISKLQPQKGRCILNFYGPPGTGKTRAAKAIAARLQKKLYQVEYSAVISKYMGDTAKGIVACFQAAKENDAVLFFDEADSLLSKRVDMDNSCATSINQNRNVLMQQLDQFEGIVIVTTNLFGHYDPALLRRIARHVKFRLPNKAMRKQLFAFHLPNPDRVHADLTELAEEAKGLSGGDILTVCTNAIYAGSMDADPAAWHITSTMLSVEVQKVLSAKADHTGNN